ncbi:MAG TPA: acyl-CoA dehydrogenase family protein [Ferrovibrio sp.]|jgi:acyl-CoA dehydrogenase|uniref:acyl-CoA dehydrogenase family protein n=1 Tax=Ferrovibrio sp. TaxID=1917215 RepID=UPI002ED23883
MNAPFKEPSQTPVRDLPLAEAVRSLGRNFAARAAELDANDAFAAENFAEIKAARLLSLGIPAELGGGGASYRDLAETLRELARHCSGTALALAMHMHPVAAAVWRWQNDRAPVDGLLRRIAGENLMLLSTGGNDWLNGSGSAEAVEGGYRVSGVKRFVSGCMAGDLLMTMARCGDQVLHAGIPMRSAGVSIKETWRTLGMRASGSHDVVLDNVFVPEAAIALRRPAGVWHPFFHLVALVAFPLIYAVYRGVAEALRDDVVALARRRREEDDTQIAIGQLETALAAAIAAHERMLALADQAKPGMATTASMMSLRQIVGSNLLDAAQRALDAAGGSAYYRTHRIERLFRDLQAARYHPLAALSQQRLAGRIALDMDADDKTAA